MVTIALAPNEFSSLIRREITNCEFCGVGIKYAFVHKDRGYCHDCYCKLVDILMF